MNEKRVEVVLIEDNPTDVELALHALKKQNVANKIVVLKDGEGVRKMLIHAALPEKDIL